MRNDLYRKYRQVGLWEVIPPEKLIYTFRGIDLEKNVPQRSKAGIAPGLCVMVGSSQAMR